MPAVTVENPDYEGPEGRSWREKAKQYGDERHELLSASSKAFNEGDKAKAKDLSNKGKEVANSNAFILLSGEFF